VLGWVRESSLTTDQMIAKAIATKMASKDKKDKSAISTDATIANYQSQTQQIKDMKWVLICAIVAGTSLMMLSVIAPFIIVGWLHASFFITSFSKANQTSVLNTVDKLASTPGAVLPLATGLVGFAGGVVTAMFRTSTTSPPIPPGPGGQGTGGQGTGGQGTGGQGTDSTVAKGP